MLQLLRTFSYLSTTLLPQNAHRRAILQNSVKLFLIRNEISYKQLCKNNTFFCVTSWDLMVFSQTMPIFPIYLSNYMMAGFLE